MTGFSRRQFLKRSGGGAAALVGLRTLPTAASSSDTPTAAPESIPLRGRAFRLAEVYANPEMASNTVGTLLPDDVCALLGTVPNRGGQPGFGKAWYRVRLSTPGTLDLNGTPGYAPADAVQPIAPYVRPPLVNACTARQGLWAEVVAPYSAVHGWCAAAAPVVARLGFGAVVYVVDYLTDDHGQIWYGLASAPGADLVGWAAALHYAPWIAPAQPAKSANIPAIRTHLKVMIRTGDLLVYADNRLVGQVSAALPPLRPISTTVSVLQPGSSNSWLPLGVPWHMRLGSAEDDDSLQVPMHGVFWHNRFGAGAAAQASQAATQAIEKIELPALAARWLYQYVLSSGGSVPLTVE